MIYKVTLQIILGIWVAWHLAFSVFATFLPATGARLSGWSPEDGWTGDMLALSTQYGMVMLLLALTYMIALLDPLRYVRILWVAIAEQVSGIGYATYIYFAIGNVTLAQIGVQSVVNLAVIAVLVLLWRKLRSHYVSATT